MTESKKPFVILIDTNAMAALSLYVESCTTVGANLGTTIEELKEKFEKIKCINKEYLKDYLYFGEKGGIKDGYKLFKYLRIKREEFDNIQIWFSQLSEIELLNVFLDRTFDRELTRKGIPYRIRRKKPFRTQIDFNYEEEITKNWEDIKEKLSEQGIEFENPEKESDAIQDIIKVAKIVTQYVALEPVDLYLYASAVYLRADEIYTHDKEFRTIINKILTDNEWRNIYNNVQQDLRKCTPSFEKEYEVENRIALPKGVS
ncbi:hypothetical protein DRN50_06045 [Thermococci archaeon]|nr:MAG: hypothetical protein DRN50_06045 [Thermococci archaeon]